jgi:hypothetical protein
LRPCNYFHHPSLWRKLTGDGWCFFEDKETANAELKKEIAKTANQATPSNTPALPAQKLPFDGYY